LKKLILLVRSRKKAFTYIRKKSCPIPEKPMNTQLTMNNRPEKPNPIPNHLIPIAVESLRIQIHENPSNPMK
jgi:hypothetical protein